jgi:drug/metabolite transporter (DMT)-like permease
MQPPKQIDLRAAAILTLCCLIWGVGMVMIKLANAGISPVVNAALRSVMACSILFLFAAWRGVKLFERDGTLWIGLCCGIVFAIEFIGLYTGLTLTTASRGTLFMHAAPFVAAAGEHFLVPGHRLTGIRVLGLTAAFLGLALALGEGLMAHNAPSLTGDLLCLLGGIGWGTVTVLVKTSKLRTAPPEKTMLYQLGFSSPVLLAWAWYIGEAGITSLTPAVIGAFLYTVLLVVVFGYTIWFWMMRTYSAASLHAFTFLSPIFGAIAGHLILGEHLGTWTIGALGLVAVGIYLVNRPTPSR